MAFNQLKKINLIDPEDRLDFSNNIVNNLKVGNIVTYVRVRNTGSSIVEGLTHVFNMLSLCHSYIGLLWIIATSPL